MTARAEQVDQTRLKIVEATVRLHGTVGPAATTVAGIAAEAGVTRVTVYKHFPDIEALYAACTAHWGAQQRRPDPTAWRTVSDPAERLRIAIQDVYRFYRDGESMLSRTTRDAAYLPPFVREANAARAEQMRQAILEAWPKRQRTTRRSALVGHALTFATWQSLCVQQGLSQSDAVRAMVKLITDA